MIEIDTTGFDCFTIPYLADPEELRDHIRPLGTQNIRSQRLIEMSKVYYYDPPVEYDLRPSRHLVSPTKRSQKGGTKARRLTEKYPPTAISHLPGAGTYALDSYRIFCLSHQDPLCEEWKTVLPTDKELVLFLVCPSSILNYLIHLFLT
jgi:methyl-CpG-binding domain protein 4